MDVVVAVFDNSDIAYQVQRRYFCMLSMGSHQLLLRECSVATFSQFRLALCAVNRFSMLFCFVNISGIRCFDAVHS